MLIRTFAAAGLALTVAAHAIAQPVITFTAADARPTLGQAMLRISGNNFWPGYPVGAGPQVFFGATAAGVLSATPTQIIAFTPAGVGTVTVTVAGAGGSGTSPGVSYTYDPPVVNAMSPQTGGPIVGNFTLTIGGNNFGTSPTVTIGGVSAPIVTADHQAIQCTVPPGIGTDKPVIVTAGGQSSSASGPKFAYAGPTIQSINPNSSPGAGGGTMDIQGLSLGLPGDPQQPVVTIGGVIAPVVLVSPTDVQVQIPSGAGVGLPVVLTRGGQSATAGITFGYFLPQITNINPASGSTTGGYSAVISGSSFGPASAGAASGQVMFGGAVASVVSWSNTSITITVPSAPAGVGANVPVRVIVGNQVSAQNTSFSYNPPQITTIRPAFGPVTGGAPIVIDGLNFGAGATVTIGGQAATVTSQSHTSISCITPTRAATPLVGAPVVVTAGAVGGVGGRTSNPLPYSYFCVADFNHTGGLEVQDVFDFLTAWFGVCQ